MTRRSILRTCAALSGLATAAALTFATPTSAAPGPAPNPATNPVIAEHTVTLISGDVVQLQTMADGNDVATVRPSADRLGVGYATREVDGQAYVVPTDAIPLLAADKLDEELFNVSALVANGYSDADSDAIGLIVQYRPGMATAGRTAAPAGTTPGLILESINAQSVRQQKAKAREFWTGLVGDPAGDGNDIAAGISTAAGPVGKIWLNRKVKVSLTESVPQIGAPQAWAAGYDGTGTKIAVLDTGIDATHPDLDGGKVIAEANFSTDSDTLDHHGHGTHVASTAAGTGEATPANRRGVAPGASLINAKVLNSGGAGEVAGGIDGPEVDPAPGARAVLRKMDEFADQTCACKDSACADHVEKKMMEWAMANIDELKDLKPTKAEEEEADRPAQHRSPLRWRVGVGPHEGHVHEPGQQQARDGRHDHRIDDQPLLAAGGARELQCDAGVHCGSLRTDSAKTSPRCA